MWNGAASYHNAAARANAVACARRFPFAPDSGRLAGMSGAPATKPEEPAASALGRRGRGGALLRYALRRLAGLVPTLLGVTLLTFVLFDVVGGSPAAIVLGKNATKEQIAEYDHVHGYDRPLAVQYVRYLGDLARGDLGESLEYREPVAKVLRMTSSCSS